MRIIFTLSIALLFTLSVNGQVAEIHPWVYASCGKDFVLSTSGFTGAYTIGEVMVSSLRGDSTWLTEGFHQADPVASVSIHEDLDADQDIRVYPNPTRDQITFELNQSQPRAIKVHLVDMLGRVLNTQSLKATWGQLVFDLSEMADSYYFLRATGENGNSIGTYKVQKIN